MIIVHNERNYNLHCTIFFVVISMATTNFSKVK